MHLGTIQLQLRRLAGGSYSVDLPHVRMRGERSEIGPLLTFHSSDHFAARLSITALEMKESLLTKAC